MSLIPKSWGFCLANFPKAASRESSTELTASTAPSGVSARVRQENSLTGIQMMIMLAMWPPVKITRQYSTISPMSIRKERIQFFGRQLADFFQKAGRRELPWRKKRITAYEVWVSEIMLQQTQVIRVIGYYERFLQRFPTVETLARASWEEFLPYYEGLGYYARGRNMLKAAHVIMGTYDGKFPREKKLLEQLPGVGPYTAAAIMSFAYGANHLAWDTNLKRVIGRFFLGGKHLITDEKFWDEKFTLPKQVMNAALMDFGSALCTARPKCEACSLRSRCVYYRERGVQEKRISVRRPIRSRSGQDSIVTRVFLHENHKKYFSAKKGAFQPFILPSGYESRAAIKDYFLKRYDLTVAVRPPHEKRMAENRVVISVNAQILLGEAKFAVFSKKEVTEYNEKGYPRRRGELSR